MTPKNRRVTGTSHDTKDCKPIREVLSRVGDKWSMLIIGILSKGPQRFNALRRGIEGISQRMLTLTLRQLERDGLVSRRVEDTVPPSVYYDLTSLGQTLTGPVFALATWAKKNHPAIMNAQQVFDRKH